MPKIKPGLRLATITLLSPVTAAGWRPQLLFFPSHVENPEGIAQAELLGREKVMAVRETGKTTAADCAQARPISTILESFENASFPGETVRIPCRRGTPARG